MALFPMFVELSGKNVLIIGGGSVALRKCEKLLPYGAVITAVFSRFQPQFISLEGVKLLFRPFDDADVEGRDMVIAATDDRALNRARRRPLRREAHTLQLRRRPGQLLLHLPLPRHARQAQRGLLHRRGQPHGQRILQAAV